MTKISVIFLFTSIFFNCDIEAKSFANGMKNEREIQQDEIVGPESLFENSRYPNGYDESNGYSKVGLMYDMPNFRTNPVKRSLREHNAGQRQTGIIYGGGKPIGILQPYQESFKFMPIKEEHVYSLDGGRSNIINQQEPYLNLMYPLARFTRSEDAIRLAELEAAKAEFLDKHYPSMLVDFKIHNKLHPTGYNAKSVTTFNLKREETDPKNKNDMRKKKRESLNPNVSSQKLHKRDNQHAHKRDNSINMKKTEQISTLQKREDKKEVHKREEVKSTQKQQAESEYVEQSNIKRKRQGKLTDSEFENLKKNVAKRNSNGNIQIIEEDLKSLLSDMGLIEDDLEENAEEMEESKSAVVQDDNPEKEFGTTIQKDKETLQVEEKGESKLAPERKKRGDGIKMNTQSSSQLSETKNCDSIKRAVNNSPNKLSAPDTQDSGKRFIEVSFSSKEDKEPFSGNVNDGESCPKPSVIPNKREISKNKPSQHKCESSIHREEKADSTRSEDSSVPTTETYEQYEERVAREIKNKIKQLKEEVKRELGALESDKEEEDDDDGSLGEPQRKKRFIVNTLMDEETHNIDPNENLDSAELEPHVRRRRTLSTDMISPFKRSHSNSYERSKKLQNINLINLDPMSVDDKLDFGVGSYNDKMDGLDQSFINQGPHRKSEFNEKDAQNSNARQRKGSNYNNNIRDHAVSRSYRWDDTPIYFHSAAKIYSPEYQRENPSKYVAIRRNARNDFNSEGGSYNDYEDDASNANSEEEAEAPLSSVVDMTSKSADVGTQQFNSKFEHSPKKLHSFNRKYIYYYAGANEKEKKGNMASHLKNAQWINPMYSYNRFGGQYPSQFYNTMNRFQGKQFKGANEKGAAYRKAFQRRFEYPLARRRKRFVNLLIPPYNEDAVVTNAFFHNYSRYPPNFWFTTRSGNMQLPLRSRTIRVVKEDGVHNDPRNITGLSNTEKGKNIHESNHEVSDGKTLILGNSPLKKYDVESSASRERSSKTLQNVREMQLKSENLNEPRIRTLKKLNNTLSVKSFIQSSYISKYMDTMKQSGNRQDDLENNQSADQIVALKNEKSFRKEEKLSGRKILSWLVNENYSPVEQIKEQIPDFREPTFISNRDSSELNLTRNSNDENIVNEMDDYHRDFKEDIYDDNYYSDTIATPISGSTALPVETEATSKVQKKGNSTKIPIKNSYEKKLSDTIPQEVSKENYTRSVKSYGNINELNYFNSELDKNNLMVENASLLSTEWKRRKRNIQPDYHQAVRTKRYWLWPSLIFPQNNAPPENEEEDFDHNDPPLFQNIQGSEISSDKSSVSSDSDVNEDLGDFANGPRNYDREKRNADSRLFYPGNKSPYFYANKGSPSGYMVLPRNRRYVKRHFREPQQQLLSEMSDSELFGALPQSYAGELARYKRVKRTDKGG